MPLRSLVASVHDVGLPIHCGRVTEFPAQLAVVVIEDDPLVLRFERRMLERAGFRVEAFDSGAAALERLLAMADDPVALVVTDLQLPDLRGDAIARTVHEQFGEASPPFVLVSGSVDDLKPDAAGLFAAVLGKPVSAETLVTVARTAISGPSTPVTTTSVNLRNAVHRSEDDNGSCGRSGSGNGRWSGASMPGYRDGQVMAPPSATRARRIIPGPRFQGFRRWPIDCIGHRPWKRDLSKPVGALQNPRRVAPTQDPASVRCRRSSISPPTRIGWAARRGRGVG